MQTARCVKYCIGVFNLACSMDFILNFSLAARSAQLDYDHSNSIKY